MNNVDYVIHVVEITRELWTEEGFYETHNFPRILLFAFRSLCNIYDWSYHVIPFYYKRGEFFSDCSAL